MRIVSGILLISFPGIAVAYLYWELGGAVAGLSAVLLLIGVFLATGSTFRTTWTATLLYTAPYVIVASGLLATAFPSISPIAQRLVTSVGSPPRVFLPALVVLMGLGITAEYEDEIYSAGWETPISTLYNILTSILGAFIGWLVIIGTGRAGINVSPLVMPFLILALPFIAVLKRNETYERVVLLVEVQPKPGNILVDCGEGRKEVPVTGWGARPTRIEIELETAPKSVVVTGGERVKKLKPVARGVDGGTLFLLYREEG